MAGNAARRIALIGLLALTAALSWGAFGNASFTKLSADRIVIFGGGDRFVLKRDAAWVLANDKQAEKFKKWREKAELSADLGELVAGLPKDREIPLIGEVSEKDKTLSFAMTSGGLVALKLVPASDGFVPDDTGKTAFAAMAKSLQMKPSTLILDLADTGGDVSEAKAWGKVLDRFKTPEFFIAIGKRQGVLWAHSANSIPTDLPTNNPTTPNKVIPAGPAKPKEPEAGTPIWAWAAIGILAAGNVAFFVLRAKGSAESDEQLSHHERQLVEKVREEQKKLKVDSKSMGGAEELVVGKMIEAFDGYDKINNERLDLIKYKQYSEKFEEFDRRAQEIKKQSDERQVAIERLHSEIEKERGRTDSLQKELKRAKDTIAGLEADLASAVQLTDDIGMWQLDFRNRLEALAGKMRNE